MKSSELMAMAEKGLIEEGRIIIDQENIEYVFTGKSFQPLDWENRDRNKFYGLCVNDNWIITDEILSEESE